LGGGEGAVYGSGWALEDADLAVAFFEDRVDGAHEFELDVVGGVGVVEVEWGVAVVIVFGGRHICDLRGRDSLKLLFAVVYEMNQQIKKKYYYMKKL
jgi:hypothetical protein